MTTPRDPPHSREAERAVLAACLVTGGPAYDAVADLIQPEHFYLPAHAEVMRAMGAAVTRGRPIDVVTVESELKTAGMLNMIGGIEGLVGISDRVDVMANLRSHAERVFDLSLQRDLIAAGRRVTDDAMQQCEDVDELIAGAESAILSVSQDRGGNVVQPMKAHLNRAMREVVAAGKGESFGITTGITKLDDMTQGLQPRDLVILAGRPSMGKTALAMNIIARASLRAARDMRSDDPPPLTPCLFFSVEMGATDLVKRMWSQEGRVDMGSMRGAGHLGPDAFAELMAVSERVAASPIHVDDSAAPTISQIRSRARRWRSDRSIFPTAVGDEGGIAGLIVVDYLQLVGASRNDRSREQEVSEVARGLKVMAKETNCAVLALSQLNRSLESREDKRPRMSDLRESGAIEQDADVIMFVYREEQYVRVPEVGDRDYDSLRERLERVRGLAELIVSKQRNGPTGTVHCAFLKQYTRFENRA